MRILAQLAFASSLVGCASESTRIEPPETLVDGAADYWSSPTPFGALYEYVLQRGEITSNVRFPSWDFSVTGEAYLGIFTNEAPTETPELTRTDVFLYKQRDDGTWRRIARSSDAQNTMGHLFKRVEEGAYRVIVTAAYEDQVGEFQIQMHCDGAGCTGRDAQCLVRDGFYEVSGVHQGSLRDIGRIELSPTSELNDVMKAQLIAAVNESSSTVSTVADAFAAVDGEVANYVRFRDELVGRNLVAIEYGAGENSFGAFFLEDSPTVAAAIHDGFIEGCTLVPRACVFGQRLGETAYMHYMTKWDETEYASPTGIDPDLAKQIAKTVGVSSIDDAFGAGPIRVTTYQKNDYKRWVEITYDAGGTPMGAFFPEHDEQIVATIADGEINDCTAVYE